MSETEYDYAKPAAPFPYYMKTTSIMEHSRGVAWTANLLRKGAVIGTIEQMGDGGPDRVDIWKPTDRLHWQSEVLSAFGGDEEVATFYLLCEEEG